MPYFKAEQLETTPSRIETCTFHKSFKIDNIYKKLLSGRQNNKTAKHELPILKSVKLFLHCTHHLGITISINYLYG